MIEMYLLLFLTISLFADVYAKATFCGWACIRTARGCFSQFKGGQTAISLLKMEPGFDATLSAFLCKSRYSYA